MGDVQKHLHKRSTSTFIGLKNFRSVSWYYLKREWQNWKNRFVLVHQTLKASNDYIGGKTEMADRGLAWAKHRLAPHCFARVSSVYRWLNSRLLFIFWRTGRIYQSIPLI